MALLHSTAQHKDAASGLVLTGPSDCASAACHDTSLNLDVLETTTAGLFRLCPQPTWHVVLESRMMQPKRRC